MRVHCWAKAMAMHASWTQEGQMMDNTHWAFQSPSITKADLHTCTHTLETNSKFLVKSTRGKKCVWATRHCLLYTKLDSTMSLVPLWYIKLTAPLLWGAASWKNVHEDWTNTHCTSFRFHSDSNLQSCERPFARRCMNKALTSAGLHALLHEDAVQVKWQRFSTSQLHGEHRLARALEAQKPSCKSYTCITTLPFYLFLRASSLTRSK